MALTLAEQWELKRGDIGPVSPNTLEDLVLASAYNNAVTFSEGYKIFDAGANPEANTYLEKVLGVSNNVIRQNRTVILAMVNLIVTQVGLSAFTYAQVSGATDAQFETFINDEIQRAFELYGGVRQDEKTAYDAL